MRALWLAVALALAACAEAPPASTPVPAEDALERAIAWLAEEVPSWKRENGCYSCHNNIPGFHTRFVPPSTGSVSTQCTNCHMAIHGSNFNEYFLR